MKPDAQNWHSLSEVRKLIETVKPHTYLVEAKLHTLIRFCEHLNSDGIPGDFVECGVYKGGSAAVLSRYLGTSRHLWLYDSFEGMPETSANDGETAKEWIGRCVASVEEVKEVMTAVSTRPERYTIRKGWFRDTFIDTRPSQVALLHCDCDWYESVTLVLETFYPLVPVGGCVILDDFGFWEGCRTAFYDFCLRHGEKPLLERVERDQAFWIKGRPSNRVLIPNLLDTHERGTLEKQQLQATIADLGNKSAAWEAANVQLDVTRRELDDTRTSLQQAREFIETMQRTKLWKLRRRWFRVKRLLRLPGWETE
jgi:O-methyltransferase